MCAACDLSYFSAHSLLYKPKKSTTFYKTTELICHIKLWISYFCCSKSRNVYATSKPALKTSSQTVYTPWHYFAKTPSASMSILHFNLQLISPFISSSSLPHPSVACAGRHMHHFRAAAKLLVDCLQSDEQPGQPQSLRPCRGSSQPCLLCLPPHTGLISAALHLKTFPPSSSGAAPGRN